MVGYVVYGRLFRLKGGYLTPPAFQFLKSLLPLSIWRGEEEISAARVTMGKV